MIYIARTQRVLLGFLMSSIILPHIIIKDFSMGFISYIQFAILVFLLAEFFIHYEFIMENDFLSYQIKFWTMPIYKKVIYPEQIIQLKFTTEGWATKGVIICLKKGLNIRIFGFNPDEVLKDILNYGKEKNISITKSKDYLVLEKITN
ncbi:hypothetical protein OKW24_003891 [Peribacillus simplex]|uniref:hypothetical protein n=1 Tax=Peribacillus simplex TaxID=1478 RepID=UPI0024E22AB6|nr:hypothetical protein [Peribacillus simplex]MDF9762118.1 hypothetical protein [Peribacillus simplex]